MKRTNTTICSIICFRAVLFENNNISKDKYFGQQMLLFHLQIFDLQKGNTRLTVRLAGDGAVPGRGGGPSDKRSNEVWEPQPR